MSMQADLPCFARPCMYEHDNISEVSMLRSGTWQLDRADRDTEGYYVDTHVLPSPQTASGSIWSGFHLQHS